MTPHLSPLRVKILRYNLQTLQSTRRIPTADFFSEWSHRSGDNSFCFASKQLKCVGGVISGRERRFQ